MIPTLLSTTCCLHCRVYEMELRLDTPVKFLHPCYEALTWFAAQNLLKEIKGECGCVCVCVGVGVCEWVGVGVCV